MYNVSADILDVVIAVVTSESERERATHKKSQKIKLTTDMTADK